MYIGSAIYNLAYTLRNSIFSIWNENKGNFNVDSNKYGSVLIRTAFG